MRCWLLVMLCACRFHFDPISSDPSDAAVPTTTITFGERPTSQHTGVTTDTYLHEAAPANNYGRAEDLSLAGFPNNNDHAVVRFDLASLAPATHVVAVELHLAKLDYGDDMGGSLDVWLLDETFVEGTRVGGAGTGASWSTRDGTAQAWSTAGGTGSRMLATLEPVPDQIAIAIDPAVVQTWLDDPATNRGLLLETSPDGHYHLHASDSTLDGMTTRPELAVDVAE